MTTIGHNSGLTTPELLRQTVAKIERVNADMEALKLDRAELYSEAKGNGLNPKVLRKLITKRARDEAKAALEQAELEAYESALGDYASTELGKAGAPR